MRVSLMGEELLAFRSTDGKIGLVQEACPHRRASLYFGRNEKSTGSGTSMESSAGSQYRRMVSPMGVPEPTRLRMSFKAWSSI